MKRNKNANIFIFIICSFFIGCLNVSADTGFEFCRDGTLAVFKILGMVIFIIKILVPLLLLIMGTIDIAKAVVASDDKAIKTSANMFVKRVVAGIIIFFIPTVIKFAFSLVSNASDLASNTDLQNCTNCLLDYIDCTP